MIIRKKYFLLIILPVVLCFTGCETTTIDPDTESLGYDYFPLRTGLFRDYKVHYIHFSPTNDPDTSDYYLREYVQDSFKNEEGEHTYLLARYIKDSLAHEWELDSLWKVEKNSKFVRITKNNVAFLKLVFPIKEDVTWDGNSYNSQDEDEYVMKNVNLPYQATDMLFDKSVKVMQDSVPDRIVRYILKYEIYAKEIGLVYKEGQDLNYCTKGDCPGKEIIEEGYILRQELLGNGIE